jgi:23S rRNA pseudouridine2605 synthase
LGDLKQGAVEELRRKIVRDQLGLDGAVPPESRKKPTRRRNPGEATAPVGKSSGGKPFAAKAPGSRAPGAKPTSGKPAFGKTFSGKSSTDKPWKSKSNETRPESPWDDYGNPIPRGRGRKPGPKPGASPSGRKPPNKR